MPAARRPAVRGPPAQRTTRGSVTGVWHVIGLGHEGSAADEKLTERLVLTEAADGSVTGHELSGEADPFEVHGEVVENMLTLTQVRG